MSQYYSLDGTTLWNPSNGASLLFLRQVEVFEAELGLPSGIGPMFNDDAAIDAAVFGAFADALVASYRSRTHGVITALSEGFVAVVLALAERAGIDVDLTRTADNHRDIQVFAPPPPQGQDRLAAVLAKAREVEGSMAR